MNCANHPDRERVAFCQNCGKPLCQECVRTLGTAVLCEPCLVLRTAAPGAGYGTAPPVSAGPGGAMPLEHSVPNPALAALLGLIPGVGAMYNEQYAKGIVHLVVFVILVSLASDVNGIFGLFIAGWIFYMAIEAHHTARAKRDGTPIPNPFGLNDIGERLGFGRSWPSGGTHTPGAAGFYPETAGPQAYGEPYVPPVSAWGAPREYAPQAPYVSSPEAATPPYADPTLPMYRRVPTGAIWLIGLGVFFLLSNAGLHIISGRLLGPFLLIGIGVATFVQRMTSTGHGLENDGTDVYRWRLANALHGAAWMVLIGVVWLLHELGIMPWGSSWPLFLIGSGVLLMVRHSRGGSYRPIPPYPPQAPPSGGGPVPTATPSAIVPSTTRNEAGDSAREGR